jgi:hypothetical protein
MDTQTRYTTARTAPSTILIVARWAGFSLALLRPWLLLPIASDCSRLLPIAPLGKRQSPRAEGTAKLIERPGADAVESPDLVLAEHCQLLQAQAASGGERSSRGRGQPVGEITLLLVVVLHIQGRSFLITSIEWAAFPTFPRLLRQMGY